MHIFGSRLSPLSASAPSAPVPCALPLLRPLCPHGLLPPLPPLPLPLCPHGLLPLASMRAARHPSHPPWAMPFLQATAILIRKAGTICHRTLFRAPSLPLLRAAGGQRGAQLPRHAAAAQDPGQLPHQEGPQLQGQVRCHLGRLVVISTLPMPPLPAYLLLLPVNCCRFCCQQ